MVRGSNLSNFKYLPTRGVFFLKSVGEAIMKNYICKTSSFDEVRKLSYSKLEKLANSEWKLGNTVTDHINSKLNTQRSYLFMDRVNN